MARLCAFMLLALFVNALVIQGLHYHHDEDKFDHHQNKVEDAQYLNKVDTSKLSCKLCEVIKHQSHFYQLPSIFTRVVFLENSIEIPTFYVAQHPVGYILSATNKGPPAISA